MCMMMHRRSRFLAACLGLRVASAVSLVSQNGESAAIPSWDLQSSEEVGTNLAALSSGGLDTRGWHHIDSSRCTLMGCLLDAGVYRDDELFFSENLKTFNASRFHAPWIYRYSFGLRPSSGQHYFLTTNGITSKADVYVNGQEVANKSVQAGSYAGHVYDISQLVKQENVLAVQVYPTDYNYDFALGFVDWNPYPPDNGTGVWRNIEVKQTGAVVLGPLRISTKTDFPAAFDVADIALSATAQNLEDRAIIIDLVGHVEFEAIGRVYEWKQSVSLQPLGIRDLTLNAVLNEPAIWWPKQWGAQPLYTAEIAVSVNGSVSDKAGRTFGIRQVTAELNVYNDTMFRINGYPFQVVGGGYSADIFLRWNEEIFLNQVKLTQDLGHNTVRLEGKNEHPELYDIADRMGLMVMPGWECCDKWEAWTYNEDLAVKVEWTEEDYEVAAASMRHEAMMQQSHPSILAYLVGSDYWPDDKATPLYVEALKAADWQAPIIASAARKGFPEELGPSGLKMEGPYDWVPPNYWYDTEPAEERFGAAFGFGSELGAGVGTPEISSLRKFLSESDMKDLWQAPGKGLCHMSTNTSSFHDRRIYNDALWARYGAPSSLEDYLLKAQMMDYEATRAEFEGFSALCSAERPATGLIYWMLSNAWPSLHWALFDYYLHPAGSYFGAKVGARLEHVAYDYLHKAAYVINHSIDRTGPRTISIDVIDTNGTTLFNSTQAVTTEPNTSQKVRDLAEALSSVIGVVFLRLSLNNEGGTTLSRNVYWLGSTIDTLDWESSEWYYTPVTTYADLTALNQLQTADVSASIAAGGDNSPKTTVVLENKSSVPAFFIRLNLVDGSGEDVLPVFWSDNYVTLWPLEKLELTVEGAGGAGLQIGGKNVGDIEISMMQK